MQAIPKDLMAMKVVELREEMAAREEPTTGSKARLRRQLHAVRRFCVTASRIAGFGLTFEPYFCRAL